MAKVKTVTTPNVGEDAKNLDHSNIVGGNVKWYSHSGKQLDSSSLKLNIADNPTIALLGIYPRETETHFHSGTCIQMFIGALFRIAKNWKLPKCLSMDERLNCSISWNTTQPYKGMNS